MIARAPDPDPDPGPDPGPEDAGMADIEGLDRWRGALDAEKMIVVPIETSSEDVIVTEERRKDVDVTELGAGRGRRVDLVGDRRLMILLLLFMILILPGRDPDPIPEGTGPSRDVPNPRVLLNREHWSRTGGRDKRGKMANS